MSSLLEDLQALASHLSPSDFGTSDPVLGALVKVLEGHGVSVPPVKELLPDDHPSQIAPPAPAAGQPAADVGGLLARVEAALSRLEGHSSPGRTPAGSESSAPSSEPASTPEPASTEGGSASWSAGPELDRQ